VNSRGADELGAGGDVSGNRDVEADGVGGQSVGCEPRVRRARPVEVPPGEHDVVAADGELAGDGEAEPLGRLAPVTRAVEVSFMIHTVGTPYNCANPLSVLGCGAWLPLRPTVPERCCAGRPT
jgi:hypothetical protein